MGGAASVAADKVVATVGSVKALPPYLESEVKALMLKVRHLPFCTYLVTLSPPTGDLLPHTLFSIRACSGQSLQRAVLPSLCAHKFLLGCTPSSHRWAMRGRGWRRCRWWAAHCRRCSRPSTSPGTSTWRRTMLSSPPRPTTSASCVRCRRHHRCMLLSRRLRSCAVVHCSAPFIRPQPSPVPGCC
jgi:hypothetical protein